MAYLSDKAAGRTPGFYISLLLLAPWVEKRAKQRCRMSRSRGKEKRRKVRQELDLHEA